jgi:hypothetical protein
MEKAEAHGGKIRLPTDGKSKAETLADAGISLRTAERYQTLAGPKLEQAVRVVDKATEAFGKTLDRAH